jgi:hypothetical protein
MQADEAIMPRSVSVIVSHAVTLSLAGTKPVMMLMMCCAVLLQSRFVAGGEDMWVHLHDADTGAELEVNKGHHGPVHTVR